MMSPLVKIESDAATDARVRTLVLQPMIGDRTPGLLAHAPREHSAAGVAHVHCPVIPASRSTVGIVFNDVS